MQVIYNYLMVVAGVALVAAERRWAWWAIPRDVPKLYQGRGPRWLSRMLPDEELERLMRAPMGVVLPLISRESSRDEAAFGAALSRLLIRDLMLIPSWSIQAAGDTPHVFWEGVSEAEILQHYDFCVTGRARFDAGLAKAEIQLYRRGQAPTMVYLRFESFAEAVRTCSLRVAEALGEAVSGSTLEKWKTGRPSDYKTFVEYGYYAISRPGSTPLDRIIPLRMRDRKFTLPLDLVEPSDSRAWELLLQGIKDDPNDAQLFLELYFAVRGRFAKRPGMRLAALQFVRKAIDLSHGYGKAHMCAPTTAHAKVDMLRHAELGHRLLPGNSFAISNLVNALLKRPGLEDRVLELCEEAIDADPKNPSAYWQAISILEKNRAFKAALEYARRLDRLFIPPMAERTRYCIEQSPQGRAQLASGKYNPRATCAKMIARFERLAEGQAARRDS